MSLLDRAIVRAYSQRASTLAAQVSEPSSPPAPAAISPEVACSAEQIGAESETITAVATLAPPAEEKPSLEAVQSVALSPRPKIEAFNWTWPRIVQQLLNQAEYGFLHLAQQLTTSVKTHHKQVIAFISSGQGDGCTSVMLTIAQILTRRKEIRTLILEANPGHPSHLELLQGKGDCVRDLRKSRDRIATPDRPWKMQGEMLAMMPISLQESIIHSDSDHSEWEKSIQDRMAGWRNEYDLILMDIGPVMQSQVVRNLWWHDLADRVITITSSSRLSANPQGFIDDTAWEEAGIEPLGVIETFA